MDDSCSFCRNAAYYHHPKWRLCIWHYDALRDSKFHPWKTQMNPKYLVIDIETTGLADDDCRILEIAAIICDEQFNPLWNWTTPVAVGAAVLARLQQNKFVTDMHLKSGLIGQTANGSLALASQNPLPLWLVEQNLCDAVDAVWPDALRKIQGATDAKNLPVLAGASPVALDLPLIRRWLPELARRLSYRVVDSSVIAKSLAPGLDWPKSEGADHRAASDAQWTVQLLRSTLAKLGVLG